MTEENLEVEKTLVWWVTYYLWRRWWIARTLFSIRFWKEPFNEYPQTWMYLPRIKWMRRVCEWVCKHTTGHDISKTEWGYGGDGKVDRWCRWCNKLIKQEIETARFTSSIEGAYQSGIFQDIDENAASDTGQQGERG